MTQFFWVNGTGTLSNTTTGSHLSLTSGGTPIASQAIANTDDLVFDANSGTGTVTVNTIAGLRSWDSSACPAGLIIAGSGQVTLSGTTSNGAGFCYKWGGAGAHTYTGIVIYTNTVVASLDAVFSVVFPGNFRVNSANADITIKSTVSMATLSFTAGKMTIPAAGVTATTSLTTAAGTKNWVMNGDIICTNTTSFTGASAGTTGTGVIHLRSTALAPSFDGFSGAGYPPLVWEPADRQVATITNWAATGAMSSFKIDASVQANVKTASINIGAPGMTTGTISSFTTTINSGQRIQFIQTGGTFRALSVTMSNLTFAPTVATTLAGGGSWSGTNIGLIGTAPTGLTASVGANQFFVGGSGAKEVFNGADSNNWASSSGGSGGTGRSPLPQDNMVVDTNSGTGTLTANTQSLCTDLTVTGGPTFGCAVAWAGYVNTLGSAAGVVTPSGNVSFTVDAAQTGRLGVSTGKTIKMTLGPLIYSSGSPAPKLSGASRFAGLYCTNGFDLNGFALILDGGGTLAGTLIDGGIAFTTLTVSSTLTLQAPTTAYSGSAFTPTFDVTGGLIILSGGMGGAANFPTNPVTFTALTLTLNGDASVLTQYILGQVGATAFNITSLTLDRRARATLRVGATFAVTALTTTNASSSAKSKIDSTVGGTKVVTNFGSAVLIDNCDVVDNDAETTTPAVTRNGSISNTTNWNSLLTQTLTDILGVTDSRSKTTSLTFTDVCGLVDAKTSTATRVITDILGMVDTESRNVTHVITDVLGIADPMSKNVAFTIIDVVGVVDDQDIQLGLLFTDKVGAVDEVAQLETDLFILDQLGLTDNYKKDVVVTIADILGLVDQMVDVREIMFVIVDTVGFGDALQPFEVYTGRTITDSLHLVDDLTEAFNRGWKPRVIAF